MTTIALDLVIDSGPARQGAAAIEDSLNKVSAAGARAAGVLGGGPGGAAAGGVPGGSLTGAANSMNGAFTGTRQLLLATVNSLGQFGGAAAVAGQAIGLVSSAWKAGPFGIMAAVITGAAGAMTLFAESTRKTAETWRELGEAMTKADAAGRAARLLGTGGQDPRLGAIRSAIEQTYAPDAGLVSVSQFGQAAGLSRTDVLRILSQQGGPAGDVATDYLRTGTFQSPRFGRVREFPDLNLDPELQRRILARQYTSIQSSYDEAGRTSSDVYQFGSPYTRGLPEGLGGVQVGVRYPNYVEQAPAAQQQVAEEAARAAQRNMDRLIAQGEQFGSMLGGAFASAATGAGKLRDILNRMAIEMANSALVKVFAQLGGAAVGAVAGQTRQQSGADYGIAGSDRDIR